MSKSAQTITADQLAELEALSPSLAAPKPTDAHLPAPTILAGGFETKHAFCDQHNEWYQQFRQPRAELWGLPWIGECDKCTADAALLRQASAIMASRSEAIEQRVEAKLAATEAARSERIESRLKPIVEDARAQLSNDERWQDAQEFRRHEEAAETAKILGELREAQ